MKKQVRSRTTNQRIRALEKRARRLRVLLQEERVLRADRERTLRSMTDLEPFSNALYEATKIAVDTNGAVNKLYARVVDLLEKSVRFADIAEKIDEAVRNLSRIELAFSKHGITFVPGWEPTRSATEEQPQGGGQKQP